MRPNSSKQQTKDTRPVLGGCPTVAGAAEFEEASLEIYGCTNGNIARPKVPVHLSTAILRQCGISSRVAAQQVVRRQEIIS